MMAQGNKEVNVENESCNCNIDGNKEKQEYEYVPPDGGWGWLVLGGSVLVSLLIPGTIKSFGILFVEFIELFNASPVAASWIPALTYFLYCSLGPLASYLSTRYSYRTVTLLGGMFAATGMISSYFAQSIVHLYICYGILVGTGAGLSFPPGVFIVTSYFVQLRGLANGIAISGSALGSIILPPFLRFLLETYGYRGAVLIIGGLILNVLVGASLYDPVQQHLKRVPVDKSKKNGKSRVVYSVASPVEEKKPVDIIRPPEEKALLDSVYETKEHFTEDGFEVMSEYHPSPNREFQNNITQPLILIDGSPTIIMKNGGSFPALNQPITTDSAQQISRKISTGSYRGRNAFMMGSTGQITRKTSVSRQLPRVSSSTGMHRKVSITSNLSSSSFRYISTPFHGSTLVGLNPEFSSQIAMKTTQQEKPSYFKNLCSCFRRKKSGDINTVQNETKDGVYRALLRDPVFIIILISNASTAIGYTNFTILLPAYAISLGFDKSRASYLLSIVSTFDLVGRIGGSALSDWLPINKKCYYIGGLLLSGISLVLLPLASEYASLAFFCGAFGLSSGTYVGITAIIMVDLLGEDRLASSYGVSLFINGILQLIGPPICGVAFESINSYGPIISSLGTVLVLGATVWLYLPCVRRKKQDQEESVA